MTRPHVTAGSRVLAARTRAAAAALAAAMLGACSTPAPVARYDFGVPAADAAGAHAPGGPAGLTVQVGAPPWLDSTALLYRLAYDDEAQLRAYAQAQWVAPPAGLLEQELRSAALVAATPACATAPVRDPQGAAGPGTASGPAASLHVELLEFSQDFSTPQASQVILRARVRLLAARTNAVLGQREFELRSAASQPDAIGAAHGLSGLAKSFSRSALDWAAATLLPACAATPAR